MQRFVNRTIAEIRAYVGPLLSNRRGSIALVFAAALPVLLTLVGGSIDVAILIHQRSVLQSATDAAAIAAAKELSLSNTKQSNLSAITQSVVLSYIAVNNADKGQSSSVATSTAVRSEPTEVEVTVRQTVRSFFGNAFGLMNGKIETKATARVVGQPNICVLVLHPSENGTLSLEQRARVTGDNCAVYSNSSHNTGIKTKNSAQLTATTICSAGGVQGGDTNFQPTPYLDCPQFSDPLAGRPEPTVGACDPKLPTHVTTATTLRPGTYCGLKIDSGTAVKLAPGIYIIKDAPLIVTDGAAIKGEGVGIFLTGPGAKLLFDDDSAITLSAPNSGPMAGLLIFAARKSSQGIQHAIYSRNAQTLVGTIYIPTGELKVDGAAAVGGNSAYTAIVAKKLRLYGGPHIKLNTNYNDTNVPVPNGIRGAGQPIVLVN